jgi:L-ascorbate metabolism protein UlaG (beta-lactamase superfamily)
VTYVGHASTLIEVDGTRLLTDPVLRPRIAHVRRIVAPPAPETGSHVDAILVSHAHHDHLDVPSLRRLGAEIPVIAPPGSAALLRRSTGHEVVEIAPGGRARVGAVDVVAVDAAHDGRRFGVGPGRGAVGYLVEGAARVAFFGDTDLFAGMADLAGSLDLALLPIWGWGSRVETGHLDPERAARAAALLQPRVAVPIHWGTLAGPRVWWRADPALPARRFAAAAAALAPGVEIRILAPGERITLSA